MTPQEFFSSCLAPFVLVFGFVKFMFNGIVALAYEAIKFAAPTLTKHRDIVGLFFIWKVFYFLFCDTSSDKLFLGAVKGIYWLVCKIILSMVRYPVKALGFTVVVHSVAFQSH